MKKEKKIYSRTNKISIISLNQGSKEITFFGRIVYKIESQNFSGNVFISLTGRSTYEKEILTHGNCNPIRKRCCNACS